MASYRSSSLEMANARRRVDPARLRRRLAGMGSQGRILLVDDARDDLETINLKLGIVLGPGIEIHTATTVTTAVELALRQAGRYDILLIKHRLGPDDTGIELLKLLARCPQPRRPKAVLYSDHLTGEMAAAAIAAGFDMAVAAEELDSMTAMAELLWRLVKPDIDWSASWRGLP